MGTALPESHASFSFGGMRQPAPLQTFLRVARPQRVCIVLCTDTMPPTYEQLQMEVQRLRQMSRLRAQTEGRLTERRKLVHECTALDQQQPCYGPSTQKCATQYLKLLAGSDRYRAPKGRWGESMTP